MRDSHVRLLSRVHRMLFRVTGGRIGRRLVKNDMLLLTTTGRRTGRSHTVPLLYLEEGDTTVIIASFGGRDRHPAWYLNLLTTPSVSVQKAGKIFTATARTTSSTERVIWWPRVVAAYADYQSYQTRTDRQIPIVLLEPPGK